MRKVLVVDDEKFIRLGLKAMIERNEEVDYEVTLCRNGLEALDTLHKNQFDIIITDIRMPEMTGLELLDKVKDLHNKPEVIILSGYDEFNFAVQALRNGAREYLLKPINRDGLSKALNNIEECLIKKENEDNLLQQYEFKLDLKRLERLILLDNISLDELENNINNINIDLLKEDFYLSVITSNRTKNMQSNKGLLVQTFIKSIANDEVVFLGPNNEFVILSKDKTIINSIHNYIIEKCFNNFTIGVSDRCNQGIMIREAYSQAIKAAKYRYIMENSYLIEYCEIRERNNIKNNIPIEDIEKLSNIIGTERQHKICEIIDSILDKEVLSKNSIEYLEQVTHSINNLINKNIKLSDNFNNIYNFNSLYEYSCELKKYLLDISKSIKEESCLSIDSNGIKKALNYINANYYKDITMATVSNEVSLNYSYFSQVFKEHVGDNFVNYLRKIRIERAKELLKTTNLKIYEVSESVGYSDSKQFAKMFRKVSGLSPVEYKEKFNN